MAQKPLGLPVKVAKAFVRDIKLYFAEPNAIKRDEIAGVLLLLRWKGLASDYRSGHYEVGAGTTN